MINLKCQSEGVPGISRHGKMLVSIWLALALLPAMLTGCSQKLLRENVLATTQSMIGISLAQNPQTQIYELKIGFARNEFFLVPTSKRIVYDENDKDAAGTRNVPKGFDGDHNDPSLTPEVLAEIQVGGSSKQSGEGQAAHVEVYQRLAVGKLAVQSGAAIALMANDKATAAAVSGVRPKSSAQGSALQISALRTMYNELKGAKDETGRKIKAELDKLAGKLPAKSDFIQYRAVGVGVDTFTSAPVVPPATRTTYDEVLDYLSDLNTSREELANLITRYQLATKPNTVVKLNATDVKDAKALEVALELRKQEKLYEKQARAFSLNAAVEDGINYLFGKFEDS